MLGTMLLKVYISVQFLYLLNAAPVPHGKNGELQILETPELTVSLLDTLYRAASFGPAVNGGRSSLGKLFRAETTDGCSQIQPGPTPTTCPCFAVMKSFVPSFGNCSFSDQVLAIQKAGFTGAIIYSSDGDELITMGAQIGQGQAIAIYSVFVGSSAGAKLLQYSNNDDYVVFLHSKPPKQLNKWALVAILAACYIVVSTGMTSGCVFWDRNRTVVPPDTLTPQENPILAPAEPPSELFACIHTSTFTQDVSYDPCPICLENFTHGDELGSLPCSHAFHNTCIRRWLTVVFMQGRSVTCALCKCLLNSETSPLLYRDRNGGSSQGTTQGTSETGRGTSGTSRGTSETSRETSETSRETSETSPGTSETGRGSSETGRRTRGSSRRTRATIHRTSETGLGTSETGPATSGRMSFTSVARSCTDQGRHCRLCRSREECIARQISAIYQERFYAAIPQADAAVLRTLFDRERRSEEESHVRGFYADYYWYVVNSTTVTEREAMVMGAEMRAQMNAEIRAAVQRNGDGEIVPQQPQQQQPQQQQHNQAEGDQTGEDEDEIEVAVAADESGNEESETQPLLTRARHTSEGAVCGAKGAVGGAKGAVCGPSNQEENNGEKCKKGPKSMHKKSK